MWHIFQKTDLSGRGDGQYQSSFALVCLSHLTCNEPEWYENKQTNKKTKGTRAVFLAARPNHSSRTCHLIVRENIFDDVKINYFLCAFVLNLWAQMTNECGN